LGPNPDDKVMDKRMTSKPGTASRIQKVFRGGGGGQGWGAGGPGVKRGVWVGLVSIDCDNTATDP